jgi:hypothetical protein
MLKNIISYQGIFWKVDCVREYSTTLDFSKEYFVGQWTLLENIFMWWKNI